MTSNKSNTVINQKKEEIPFSKRIKMFEPKKPQTALKPPQKKK